MGKLKANKRKLKEIKDDDLDVEVPKKVRASDEPIVKKKWINKQRILIFAYRGISHRDRHLMKDLKSLLPHSKPESKMERKDNLLVVNEICEMKNCNKCLLFEGRLKRDLYLWVANTPDGPSAKFLVESVYTMAELKMTGNCLKGSRPLLSFDENFTKLPHYSLLKELFVQVFGTPNQHPKSQPFTDHVMTFSVLDNRIWFRNYQILSEDGALAEIGPRFVLNPIKIFEGSFRGETLWQNPHYVAPSMYRRQVKTIAANKYENRIDQKMNYEATKPKESYNLNPVDEVFTNDPLEKASEIKSRDKNYEQLIEGPKLAQNKHKKEKKIKPKLKQKKKSDKSKKIALRMKMKIKKFKDAKRMKAGKKN
ncbi:Ribosome biogenesis protein BRX1 [Blattella germanica]|nr:Ribosome biogenesis protein BRX1 [Blattella germanica]